MKCEVGRGIYMVKHMEQEIDECDETAEEEWPPNDRNNIGKGEFKVCKKHYKELVIGEL